MKIENIGCADSEGCTHSAASPLTMMGPVLSNKIIAIPPHVSWYMSLHWSRYEEVGRVWYMWNVFERVVTGIICTWRPFPTAHILYRLTL